MLFLSINNKIEQKLNLTNSQFLNLSVILFVRPEPAFQRYDLLWKNGLTERVKGTVNLYYMTKVLHDASSG